jgi:predicted transcriptional regulator
MPDVRITIDEEENAAVIKESTRLGMSKTKYVHRELRHTLIRKGLVKQTVTDKEIGLVK